MNDTKNELTVGGFLFGTKEDAKLARQEEEKIAYIEKRMDYKNAENVEAIFRKALENRVFQTPVGFVYLKKLQSFLREQGVENVPDIPMYHIFATNILENVEKTRARLKRPTKKDIIKIRLRRSVALNMALIIVIIALFAIALTSSNPNVLNYERTIQNRYAQWEEDLKAREAAVREKELLYKNAE